MKIHYQPAARIADTFIHDHVVSGIWTRDIGRALRTAKGIQAGVLSVNTNSSVHTEAPFGGYKMSGIGRELGMHALELYTETKNVFVDLS